MIILLCILLGLFMDASAMLMITIPVVYPVVSLEFDPICFGIITVLTVELGLITPQMGMNIFVIKVIAPHIKLADMFTVVILFIIL
nr:TRAP transporter large permease subunit [Neisseria zalophi]